MKDNEYDAAVDIVSDYTNAIEAALSELDTSINFRSNLNEVRMLSLKVLTLAAGLNTFVMKDM